MRKLLVVGCIWTMAAAVAGCGSDSNEGRPSPSASQIEEAEKVVRDELPAIPLWEKATFRGVATEDGDVCVSRILAKQSAELLGGGRASSYVIVAIPAFTTGKPLDGRCGR